MNILDQIREGIWQLNAKGCKDENLIIAYSPLVERYVINNAAREMSLGIIKGGDEWQLKKIQGIKTYNLHPYNEILIYDTEKTCIWPELKFTIIVEEVTSKIVKSEE